MSAPLHYSQRDRLDAAIRMANYFLDEAELLVDRRDYHLRVGGRDDHALAHVAGALALERCELAQGMIRWGRQCAARIRKQGKGGAS